MRIDELLKQVVNYTDDQILTISNEWSQGRTVFGGLSAALLLAVAQNQVDSERLLRSFHCNFTGPFFVEQEYTFKVEVLRAGKNVSVLQSSIIQNESICVQAQIVFGAKRESKFLVKNKDMHNMELPKKPSFIPHIPKLTPQALKHFELAIVEGKPFTGSKDTTVSGWMRFKESTEQMSTAHLIALIDSWPPTLLQQLRLPAPASTMTWTLTFIQPMLLSSANSWFAYQAKTRDFSDGYGVSEANIWDEQGQLLAISQQIFTIFA